MEKIPYHEFSKKERKAFSFLKGQTVRLHEADDVDPNFIATPPISKVLGASVGVDRSGVWGVLVVKLGGHAGRFNLYSNGTVTTEDEDVLTGMHNVAWAQPESLKTGPEIIGRSDG